MNKLLQVIVSFTGILFLLSMFVMIIILVASIPVWVVTSNMTIFMWDIGLMLTTVLFGLLYTLLGTYTNTET
mgnify:FL=1